MLGSIFGVRGIPALVVIDARDGSIITKDGRSDVSSHGAGAFALWESQLSPGADTGAVEMLLDNPPEIGRAAAEILLRLFRNVQKDPQSIKFRSVRLSNPKIESGLLVANGAFEVLFSRNSVQVRASKASSSPASGLTR